MHIKDTVQKNWNKYFIDAYMVRPIAFLPKMAEISGSAVAGLFISQALYWHEKGWAGEWVYKTIEDMREETSLNRSEQQRAIKIWKELGVLEKEVRGIPPKRYFRIDIPTLEKLVIGSNQNVQTSKSKSRSVKNTITESTTKNTNIDPVYRKFAVRVDRF